MKEKYIYLFIGTTAELIKVAPVIKVFKEKKIRFKIITSGQNPIDFTEMEEYIGKQKADIAFTGKGYKSSQTKFIFWTFRAFFSCLFGLRKEFKGKQKDKTYFLVHGDTISTLLGAVIAKIYRLKLVHVESGLRSFNFFEPFPEEICRVITSFLADIHFCPNEWCMKNLSQQKGVKINTVQNTLYETFSYVSKHTRSSTYSELLKGKKYFMLVIHRQEIMFKKQATKKIVSLILDLSAQKNIQCVFVMHHMTKKFLEDEDFFKTFQEERKMLFIPRLPYFEFTKVFTEAQFIVTDGGSNQEEAYYAGIPCLLLRNATERIEGLKENVVLSKNNETSIRSFFKNPQLYRKQKPLANDKPSTIIYNYLYKGLQNEHI